jgi:indoleamine 2,3-dioxygenase
VLSCKFYPLYIIVHSLTTISAGFKPFMEYAGSYALFNYRLEDPSRGLEYDNLRLIRAFEHGLDPKSSEAGFVLVHVDMVQNSGPLVDGVMSALDACENNDRQAFDVGLNKVIESMTKVNKVMDRMSKPFVLPHPPPLPSSPLSFSLSK